RAQHQQPAHGGRPLLARMHILQADGIGAAVVAHLLSNLQRAQPRDHPITEHDRHQEREAEREHRPHGHVLEHEHPLGSVASVDHGDQPGDHALTSLTGVSPVVAGSNQPRNISVARSSAATREPFTSNASPGFSTLPRNSAAGTIVSKRMTRAPRNAASSPIQAAWLPTHTMISAPDSAAASPTRRWPSSEKTPSSAMSPNIRYRRPAAVIIAKDSIAATVADG